MPNLRNAKVRSLRMRMGRGKSQGRGRPEGLTH